MNRHACGLVMLALVPGLAFSAAATAAETQTRPPTSAQAPSTGSGQGPVSPPAKTKQGRELAEIYCTGCHLFPEPATLPRRAWMHHLLPEMAKWLGMEPVDYEGMQEGRLLLEAGIYPSSPLLTEDDWFAIWDYYRSAAPAQLSAPPQPPPALGLKQFRVRKIQHHGGVPMTSLVKIDAPRKRLITADAFGGSLFALDAKGDVLQKSRLGSPPVSASMVGDRLLLTLIGRIFPSDMLEGAVVALPSAGSWTGPATVLIDRLRRPVDTAVADLNQDGRQDLVVCSYGHRLGRLSWFENKGNEEYEEHVLLERPGALRVEVRDLNGDGRPDVLAMLAQAREGIYFFRNEGAGKFQTQTVMEFPPTWGLAGLELADFNRDGHPDLVVANGDAGDFALPTKPYHGIRIYLNDGSAHFREVYFYAMPGAYRALARDFDGDGDLDLAAMAFYPDYASERPQSFVYLENLGDWKFAASTCPEQNLGRWLVMDVGDLDGDGDEDIVLGSFVRGPTTVPVPVALRDRWRAEGAVLLYLENQRRP